MIPNKATRRMWLFLGLAMIVSIGACRRGLYVYVQQDKYVPQLHENLKLYRGTAIYFAPVINRAENASQFYYYSPDYRVTYEGAPSLHAYLWVCFQKAFVKLGIRVYEADPPPDVPQVQMTFSSLTDQELKFQVVVSKNGHEVVRTRYALAAAAAPDLRPAALERRAYRMIDAAVSQMLFDQDIQKSLF